jgi:hypothetical protein
VREEGGGREGEGGRISFFPKKPIKMTLAGDLAFRHNLSLVLVVSKTRKVKENKNTFHVFASFEVK